MFDREIQHGLKRLCLGKINFSLVEVDSSLIQMSVCTFFALVDMGCHILTCVYDHGLLDTVKVCKVWVELRVTSFT